MKHSHNTSDTDASDNQARKFASQIEKLLWLTAWDFASQVEDKWEKKAILDILWNHNSNEKLAKLIIEKDWHFIEQIDAKNRTETIIQTALKQSIWALKYVSEEMKTDIRVAQSIITSQVKSGQSFLEVEKYLQEYFANTPEYQLLVKYFLKTQKLAGTLARKDLTQYCTAIVSSDFYAYLKKEKIIVGIGKYIKPNEKFIKKFILGLKNAQIETLTDEQKSTLYLEVFTALIWKDLQGLTHEEKLVFAQIQEICVFDYQAQYNHDIEEWKQDLKEATKDSTESYEVEEDFEDYSPAEKLDYCYPSHSYSISSSWDYSVQLWENRELEISKREMERAGVTALENYAKFYNTLCECHLNFIWDRYRAPFTTLCNEKFGLDCFSGEWVNDLKMLKVMNFIAKTIGIPEQEFDDPDEEGQKQVGCFDDVMFASKQFKYIQATGKINDRLIYTNPGWSSTGVVQRYLQDIGCIDADGSFYSKAWK